jgi:hypothetical protein
MPSFGVPSSVLSLQRLVPVHAKFLSSIAVPKIRLSILPLSSFSMFPVLIVFLPPTVLLIKAHFVHPLSFVSTFHTKSAFSALIFRFRRQYSPLCFPLLSIVLFLAVLEAALP